MKQIFKSSKKKLNSLITKDSNFFLRRIYFTSNDGSQNTLVYQPTLDTSESPPRWNPPCRGEGAYH